jgi:hypothetical protein
MTMKPIRLALAVAAGALIAAAASANLNGTWKATLPDQGDGVIREFTLLLKQQGSTLTVYMNGASTPASDGKVSGDDFSFAVAGPRGKAIFKGRLVNGELRVVQSREGDDEHTRSMVFKKQPDKTAR